MNIGEAIDVACAKVGILPPKAKGFGRWLKTDTLSGKSGKGDGRVIINDAHVTAWNWQTGEKETVGLKDEFTPAERREFARSIEQSRRKNRERAVAAAKTAVAMMAKAAPAQHAYLASKGFPHDRALVVDGATVRSIGGNYLLPDTGDAFAILVPARIGSHVTSLQLIWEDGTKKFLAGGEIERASHRIATGAFTWLCEGFATGLSLRAAIKGLNRNDTILCCFSASNVLAVSRFVKGRRAILTDNDKPLPQYGRLGAGEYFARQADLPFLMPPKPGDDLNDMHGREGIFAVQRLVSDFAREMRL